VGSVDTLNIGGRFPSGSGRMTKTEDRVFHGKQISKYHVKATLYNRSDAKSSLGGTGSYVAYRKYFLSDVAYLSFNIGCSYIWNPDQYETFLWVEKEGGRDYSQWTKFDPKDFYEFPIPKELIKRFYSHANAAAQKNRAYFSAQNKVRREQQTNETPAQK